MHPRIDLDPAIEAAVDLNIARIAHVLVPCRRDDKLRLLRFPLLLHHRVSDDTGVAQNGSDALLLELLALHERLVQQIVGIFRFLLLLLLLLRRCMVVRSRDARCVHYGKPALGGHCGDI